MRQGYASSNNYTVYYYITNLQGDVIRQVDVNGSTAAYYEYDPYGSTIQPPCHRADFNAVAIYATMSPDSITCNPVITTPRFAAS